MSGPAPALRRRNRWLAGAVALVACFMVGLSFASVPLYRVFCAATGYGGTPQIGGAPVAPGERIVTIRFAGATQPNLPWRFAPAQPSLSLHVGEEGMAFYEALNTGTTPVTGTALYNVTPEKVGRYFHKTACFCFQEQTLAPGQQVQMPVTFWVDPAIADDPDTRDIRTITLSYTFFRSLDDAQRSGALASAGPHVGAGTAPSPGSAAAPR